MRIEKQILKSRYMVERIGESVYVFDNDKKQLLFTKIVGISYCIEAKDMLFVVNTGNENRLFSDEEIYLSREQCINDNIKTINHAIKIT